MNNKVQIKILSTQHDISDETMETIYTGNYRNLSGKHIISYDEYFEEEGTIPSKSTNLVKIEGDAIQITKKGTVNTQMYFKSSKDYKDLYQTPFGSFDMLIQTERLEIKEMQNQISATICYTLSLNHVPVSKCTIQMEIKEI